MPPVSGSTLPLKPRPVIIGSFGPPTLACIRSWGRHGLAVGMVCIRSEKETYPNSRYLSAFASLHPKYLYKKEGLVIIDDFVKKFGATGILSISEEVACWLNDSQKLINSNSTLWAPPSSVIKNVLSKQRQLDAAKIIGFDILPTYQIGNPVNEIHSIPNGHFPLCLRPDEPKTISPTFKVKLVQSQEDLIRFIENLERLEKPLLAQPFMNLPNLVVHGSRTASGQSIGLQAFLVERKFQGVTLTIRPIKLADHLQNKCVDFANYFGLRGCYHFEFLADHNKDRAYFLEVNCRLGGTTAKVYGCGYNEPLLALEAYGVCTAGRQKTINSTVSSKHALVKYLFCALRKKLTPIDYPMESHYARFIKSLYALIRYRDEVFALSDITGTLAFYRSILMSRP